MQRYHAGSCTSAVNNGSIGGIPPRDTSRAELSAVPPPANFSLNSRRSSQLTTYKLRCDKESLNSRLGPPDFHPQTPNCHEERLTKEYVQSGYRETVGGLEEAREISFSQIQTFTKPVIVNCKEAIRKRHRAINESRAQKRKAGQVYGVPLSGTLLTKPGIFPEQRPYGEDARKKWLEGLSQQHKRLRSLADHAPHGYRRKSLFEVLIRNNVPLVRAAWFIKVTYLNQVRPGSSSSSSGAHDKTQFSRSELWTKDIVDYLQYLLDEFVTRNNSRSSLHIRDRSSQMVYAGSMLAKGDQFSAVTDSEEPPLYFKWWYVVRIIQWQHAEGLLTPSLIIEWFLNQLQEKELSSVLQLLLPIMYGFIETAVLSQTYVRTLVGIAVRFIREPSPGGSDLVDNSRRAYTTTALVEMLRYLIQAVPDTFVALDCFPLPTCVVTHLVNDGSSLSKTSEDARKNGGPLEVTGVLRDKAHEIQIESLAIDRAVSSIQKRAETLARAAKPDHPGHNVAKASQVLDKVLVHGDIRAAYQLLYGYLWDGAVAECWIAEVSPGLRSSLKHIGRVTSSLICSTFFICEWAACDFRDFRTVRPHGMQFTGRKDFSQIYIAMRLLKQKMSDMQNLNGLKGKRKDSLDTFESPSPLHDIIVCWIDQHEVHNGEGFKRLQLLVREFVRAGIFHPQVYVRQLIVSGIVDGHGSMVDLEKRKRHHRILKQLHGPYIFKLMEESQIIEPSVVTEVMNVYSNERRLVLQGLLDHNKSPSRKSSNQKVKRRLSSGGGSADQWSIHSTSNLQSKYVGADIEIEELKASITVLLQFPSYMLTMENGLEESQGSVKRSSGANNRVDLSEETPGCEECRRVKRQRLSEERSFDPKLNPTDEEETWWVRKGMKSMESFKGDPPPKPAKQQGSRGRQKTVRKTQSLAQLAAARIEGSQGASTSHREVESLVGSSTAFELPSMESLFDSLLLVFHALLSNSQPSWLKLKYDSKSMEYAVFDREVAESFQNDLNRMELPETIRWRIQTAMPILFPSPRLMISCQPPSVSPASLAFLQPSNQTTALNPLNSNLLPRNLPLPSRTGTNVKTKALQLQHDFDMEIDPWTLLEDGAGSGQPSVNSALVGSTDHANLKASSWLKGAVRVRRTDLTNVRLWKYLARAGHVAAKDTAARFILWGHVLMYGEYSVFSLACACGIPEPALS
ncbi:unnamed protein product [Fraxinus pennsylvanica]|uniref:Mediator complex subunit Med12 domain-containing protein n=1 Tax=Fraxinus pennsylvanica TaxID=56036 RepID=A0AAD1Z783_9LAMI|nr:unnamed protein product [Fraxinus pennsylvanica]